MLPANQQGRGCNILTCDHYSPVEGKIVALRHIDEDNWHKMKGNRTNNIILLSND